MPVKWKKTWISDETFESAGVCDVDGDGVPDIVSGGFWYRGPSFRDKFPVCKVAAYEEYYDDFSTIAMDITGNGLPDHVTGGWWGNALRWRENPGEAGKPWPEHAFAEVGNIETTRAFDIDGDGRPEILPNAPNNPEVAYYKLVGNGEFRKVLVHRFADRGQGHGIGCGDIAGNGRMDILLRDGWFEAPADPERDEWIWHPDFADLPWGRMPGVPMLVVDVNGDGVNEIVVGNGHGYGLWWSERKVENGERTWVHHAIDPFNAQYHDLMWVDIDGDGEAELVTGKRHRAHCGREAGEWDDAGIYYFKWTGDGFAKQVIDYGPIGLGKGCGIHFAVADLTGDGRMDLIAPGKDGLYVYYNLGSE